MAAFTHSKTCFPALLFLSLTPHAGAQAGAAPDARETVAGGEAVVHPIAAVDDGVPLPSAPETRAGEFGDELLTPASGDPFFLGFAAGPYYPPADERVDPELVATAVMFPDDGRPAREVFAFVMFNQRMTSERVAALEALGARVLGFQPHYCLSVAFPADALGEIADLPFVRWLGVAQPWQKVHPVLLRELASRSPADELELWIDVHDSDLGPDASSEVFGRAVESDPGGMLREVDDPASLPVRHKSGGWRERALLERGLAVQSYDEAVKAFRVRAPASEVEALTRLDYVAFVELAGEATGLHDESMPMTCADFPRQTHDGNTSLSVVAAQVDSGFDNGHTAMDHGWGANWDLTGSAGGPLDDVCGHGTHVGGTIRGLPINLQNGYTGAAPGIGWGPTGRYYNVKLWNTCATFSVDYTALLNLTHAAYTDGSGNQTPRPHLINHSWGSASPGPYFGSEAGARALDSDIYIFQQQHIFSAGNLGSGGGQTITEQASAKNVLAVGNVNTWKNTTAGYPGNLWSSSSRGPTGDLRWKPNLVAPGVQIESAEAGTTSGYIRKTGTSMAAPHVTGIAAQLLDRHAFLRYKPAVLSALMMAGSITKDSAVLSAPSTSGTHHLNTYGTGRIDAYKASGGNSQTAVYFWGFNQNENGYTAVDFPVNANATQVTVVMHYKERPALPGASQALVNDLDMWIDRAPFTAGGNTGEFFAQQSNRDNTEVRIFNNPQAADYRIKVFPENVPPSLFSSSHVGVCAIVSYADMTPDVSFDLSPNVQYVQPSEQFQVTAEVSCPSYIASAVFLETTTAPAMIDSARITMFDGVTADLTSNMHDGEHVLLGDIPGGESREVIWTARWATEGVKPWTVRATADNIDGGQESDSVNVVVDGTAPAGPSNLVSTSHTPGVGSCSDDLQLVWNPATDPLAGVEGYGWLLNNSPATNVTNTNLQLGPGATSLDVMITAGPAWYFHLRARDRSGNWGTTQHAGPFYQQPASSSNYCVAAPNSAGSGGAHIGRTGSLSISANDFVLTCNGLPINKPSIFFYGTTQTQQVFGDGFRCAGGAITRLSVVNTGGGTTNYPLDFTDLPPSGPIQAGDTRFFQNWYRDPLAGGAGFNLSDGLRVTFCQ